jgi:hypothetical protein
MNGVIMDDIERLIDGEEGERLKESMTMAV